MAFKNHRRLALLALPGGGKTLLLKRLAVAFADPSRLKASNDALPSFSLAPIVIRCREWRDYIHLPIHTILERLPIITGKPELTGLREALLPLFREGKILLLVDGLDEIHEDGRRATFVENLGMLMEEYPSIRLVVTSREAGFSLVAPNLARFCERWRLAPLEPSAISALCDQWHLLMGGSSPEIRDEGNKVADLIKNNPSLHRLAENPLLLTMLLVVKQGAGRLPPDRVSLYKKAVEVLLDTWNVKGHDSLNPKEAVPQLAFVAHEMMRLGKQTVAEDELLQLIEEARNKVPQIRRYATDQPHAFLKRVEIRSSLLLEAGRQATPTGTISIYQFRHLTFQEYLAAVASVEGHYGGYSSKDTVLTPLSGYLVAEDWKEVIPMAAVLAGKQAEPLMAELVKMGAKSNEQSEEQTGHRDPEKPPDAILRLVQCLVEEAEASPDTLTQALQLIIRSSAVQRHDVNVRAIAAGPYGDEFLNQAFGLCRVKCPPSYGSLLGICAEIQACRLEARVSRERVPEEIGRLLASSDENEVISGLFAFSGSADMVGGAPFEHIAKHVANSLSERDFLAVDLLRRRAALFAWGWTLFRREEAPNIVLIECAVRLWFEQDPCDKLRIARSVLLLCLGRLKRNAWKPQLAANQILILKKRLSDSGMTQDALVAAFLAYHSQAVISDEQIVSILVRMAPRRTSPSQIGGIERMLTEMGTAGRRGLKELKRK